MNSFYDREFIYDREFTLSQNDTIIHPLLPRRVGRKEKREKGKRKIFVIISKIFDLRFLIRSIRSIVNSLDRKIARS